MPNFVLNSLASESCAIASGEALSSVVSLGGLRAFGLVMPSVWTAASLSFQVSQDGGVTWCDLYDTKGAELIVPAGASRYIALDPVIFAAIPMLKARSGSSSMPVNQEQSNAVTIILRSI